MINNVLLFDAYADNDLELWQQAIGLAVQHKNGSWGEIFDVGYASIHVSFFDLKGFQFLKCLKFHFTHDFQDMDLPITLESCLENLEFKASLEMKAKELQNRREEEKLQLETERRKKERQLKEQHQQRIEQNRLRLEIERREKERQIEEQHQQHVRYEAEKQALFNNLKQYFEHNFLNADKFYQGNCTQHISIEEYKSEKINYVQSWVENHLNSKPDYEQAAAIGAVENHVQVIARAGSGKTSTLVNRALFLQKHCGIAPDEMLLLAFNRKAAQEIEERLQKQLEGSIPHVMTFHALAYALVHPEESILFDEPEGQQNKSRAL